MDNLYGIIKITIFLLLLLIFPLNSLWAEFTWSSWVNLQAEIYEVPVNASYLNPLTTLSPDSAFLSWTSWTWSIDKSFLIRACNDNDCNNIIWDSWWLWDLSSYYYSWLTFNSALYFILDTVDYNNEWWNWSNTVSTTIYDSAKINVTQANEGNIWTGIISWILNSQLPSSTWISVFKYINIEDKIWTWGVLYEEIEINIDFSNTQIDSKLGQLVKFNPKTNLWELITYWKNLSLINQISSQTDIKIAKIIFDENQVLNYNTCTNTSTTLAILLSTWANICSKVEIINSETSDSLLLYSWTTLFDNTWSWQLYDWILQWPIDITNHINEDAWPWIVYETVEKIVEIWVPWKKIDLLWTWATITFNVDTDSNYSIRYYSWWSWQLYDFNIFPSSWSITINVNTLTKYSINKEIFIPWTIFIFCPEYLDFPSIKAKNIDSETIIDIKQMDYWYITEWIAITWAYFWVNDQKSSNTWYYITLAVWEFESTWSSLSLSNENVKISISKWTWAISVLSQQSIDDHAPPELIVPAQYNESQFTSPITLLSRTWATTPIEWIKWVYWVQPIFKILIPSYQALWTYTSVITMDLIEL